MQSQDTNQSDNFETKNKLNCEPEIQLPLTAVTCLNGLKHGGRSTTLFVPGENPQEFYWLLNEQFEIHRPSNTEEGHLVKDLVVARWHLSRRQRTYNKRESELYGEASQEDSPTEKALEQLSVYERYRTQAERALQRATKNVMTIKKHKQTNEKWREQLAFHMSKLKLQQDQFDFRKQQAEINDFRPKKTPVEPPPPIRFNKQNECIIHQEATITEQPGGAVTVAAQPSNEEVRNIIQNADRYINSPIFVRRIFTFTNGLVPRSYSWAMNGIDRSPDGRSPRTDITLNMDFDRWLSLAASES